MSKFRMYKGVKVMANSELFKLLEAGDEKKAAALFKETEEKAYQRGEFVRGKPATFAIGQKDAE